MNRICGLFVILAVLGDLAFCKTLYYPLPYKNQNDGYAGRLFESFFSPGEGPNEARNNTLTTPAPTTTPKPQLTTETVVYYPIYQEPIYDPSYYPIIPPYPVFYNAPLDSSQLQLENFGPYYPFVNNIPSGYSNELPPAPYLKPTLINVNPVPEIINPNFPSNAKPNPITKVNPPRVPIPSIQRTENLNNVEIEDKVQEALARELNKLLADFYARHLYGTRTPQVQENDESSAKNYTDDGRDEFKDLLSTTESTDSVTSRTPTIAEDLVHALQQEMTKKIDDQTKQIVETDKPSPSNETETIQTTQDSIDENLPRIETTSQNETDDSRKLVLNNEDESTIDVSTDKSQPISGKLENNQTSVDSKLNDTKDPTKLRRFFINAEGNECMEEAVILNGHPFKLLSCSQKSYAGKDIPARKTTRKSDVTYYTEELSTNAPTTTELTSQNLKSDEISSR